MGTNSRYTGSINERIEQVVAPTSQPVTLPQQAYGPQSVEWAKSRIPVWAWVQYTDRPAARIAAYASGWNDRIVVIVWDGPGGERSIVVWRNAVTKRAE